MLAKRIASAAVLAVLAILVVSIIPSTIPMIVVTSIIVFLAGSEFIALRWHTLAYASTTGPQPGGEKLPHPPMHRESWFIGLYYAAGIPLTHVSSHFGSCYPLVLFLAWASLWALVGCLFFYRTESNLESATQKYLNSVAGLLYITLPFMLILQMIAHPFAGAPEAPRGAVAYLVMASVFMGDTGAYFTGRIIGKSPMLPRVSPKKTWEGSLGGLAASMTTAVLACEIFDINLGLPWGLLVGLIAGVAGQAGDLFESALKRAANCKDSGRLLPGHGGMLDRIDGLLMAVPILYLIFLGTLS